MRPIAVPILLAAVLIGAAIPLATTGQLLPDKPSVTRAEPTEQELWDHFVNPFLSISLTPPSQPEPGAILDPTPTPAHDTLDEPALAQMPLVVPPQMTQMPVSIPAPPEVAKIHIDEHEPSYSLVEK